MLSLKPYRDKAAGLPDILNWCFVVDDGIVVNKDGSLLAGYEYSPPDMFAASPEEYNDLTARVNRALSRFGAGWAVWIDAIREPVESYPPREASHFPNQISAMIDRERERQFRSHGTFYDTRHTIVLQWMPPSKIGRKLQKFMYSETGEDQRAPGDLALMQFKRALSQFEDAAGQVLGLARFGRYQVDDGYGRIHQRDSLVDHLYTTLTGEPASLNLPGFYLDAVIGGRDFWSGETPKLGDNYLCTVALEGFPAESHPGILDLLDGLPMSTRWSSRFIFLDAREATSELEKYRKRWAFKIRDFKAQLLKIQNAPINEDAAQMAAETSRARGHAEGGLVTYGYYTPVIVMTGPRWDDLEEQARLVVREVGRLGFAARIEAANAVEAWHGSLPGHAYPNVRRPLIHTLNLADLLPLSSVWAGKPFAPCPFYPPESPPLLYAATGGTTPFRLNLHVDDLGHTLVFGPTGAGKSVLLSTVAVQFLRYREATVVAFDKGRSMFATVLAAGGQHFEINPNGGDDGASGMLCPLGDLSSESDIAWASEWVESCYRLQSNASCTPAQRSEIIRALNLLRDAGSRSITDFVSTVQDADVRDAMRFYTLTHPMGPLLDGQSDQLYGSANFQVFEIGELMEMGERAVIPTLLYLFRLFEKGLKGQPALLVLDEAWVMLGHPVFREKLRDWLKTLRKANCAVVIATQSLSDAQRSGMMDVLRESCPRVILLPNPEAAKDGIVEFYQQLGLNETEIQLVRQAERKREYYVIGPEGRRLIDLALGPVARAFVTVSDKPSIEAIRSMAARDRDGWALHWLRQEGVRYDEYVD